MRPAVTGYVLAGGQSSRMGIDKAFVRIDGVHLVERAVRVLHDVCVRVVILSGPPDRQREARLSGYAAFVPDATGVHQGPVAGLLAALRDAATPLVALLAVDQPGVVAQSFALLLEAVQASGAGAACFATRDRREPLPLVLRQDLLKPIEAFAAAGERRLLGIVERAAQEGGKPVATVMQVGAGSAFPDLTNLNRPEDLRRWRTAPATLPTESLRRASE